MKTLQPFTTAWRAPFLAVLILSMFFCASAPAQSAKGKPLKLKINTPDQHVYAGDPVEIEIVCLDPENEAAPAPRDYTIKLAVHLPSGKVDTSVVTVNSGETSGKVTFVPHEEGLLQLQAQHERLQEGGAFMRVRPASAKLQNAPAEREIVVSSGSFKPTITFRYSPQRTLLADGKDGATIQAFLLDESDSLTPDIRIQTFNSSGVLQPQPLVIPAGESSAPAILTSQDVQTITVEYVRSQPAALVEGEKKLQIKFGPAITQIVLDPSPAEITLVDQCDLNVKLLDSQGQALATDLPRTISFEIDQGRGEIENKEITIAPGSFQGRSTFRPTWRGQVVLASATPNLPASTATVKVSLPTTLLLLTIAGGLGGGVIAFWREQNSKWWRVLIGLLTGFVFYWGFVFNLLPLVPRNVALNPLSGLALSVIGGWLGTEVFNIILKKFGIGGNAPAEGK